MFVEWRSSWRIAFDRRFSILLLLWCAYLRKKRLVGEEEGVGRGSNFDFIAVFVSWFALVEYDRDFAYSTLWLIILSVPVLIVGIIYPSHLASSPSYLLKKLRKGESTVVLLPFYPIGFLCFVAPRAFCLIREVSACISRVYFC